ncbi:MAG TPA: ATP-binding protein [Candidatus Paceibacterota bacterium]|nr:ATP-binding protein [Candidatus Paceibacterota bacterium]
MDKPNKERVDADKVLVDLIVSALERKPNDAESLALILSRLYRKQNPKLSKRIIDVISSYSLGGTLTRGVSDPVPVDSESHLEMVTIIPPNLEVHRAPVLEPLLEDRVQTFLEERKSMSLLMESGILPSTSLLLTGQPGTGKTMLARYIASALDKPLVVLDLSSSISSLLGKTGQNLKRVLQYAKEAQAVLLLDEFDAIAKKRDDSTDLGEIKRVVNVLLMELESWPVSSVVIATSNHPELLDRAIWRRFDHAIEIPNPDAPERLTLLQKQLGDFLSEDYASLMEPISKLLDGKSPANICKFSDSVKRRIVLKKENPGVAALHELEIQTGDKKIRGEFCIAAKQVLGDKITVRELGEITGLSPAGVQHHISKTKV